MGANHTPLAYSAYTPGTLKDSSLTLRATGEKRFTRHASPNPIDSVSLTKIILPITKSEFFC